MHYVVNSIHILRIHSKSGAGFRPLPPTELYKIICNIIEGSLKNLYYFEHIIWFLLILIKCMNMNWIVCGSVRKIPPLFWNRSPFSAGSRSQQYCYGPTTPHNISVWKENTINRLLFTVYRYIVDIFWL